MMVRNSFASIDWQMSGYPDERTSNSSIAVVLSNNRPSRRGMGQIRWPFPRASFRGHIEAVLRRGEPSAAVKSICNPLPWRHPHNGDMHEDCPDCATL